MSAGSSGHDHNDGVPGEEVGGHVCRRDRGDGDCAHLSVGLLVDSTLSMPRLPVLPAMRGARRVALASRRVRHHAAQSTARKPASQARLRQPAGPADAAVVEVLQGRRPRRFAARQPRPDSRRGSAARDAAPLRQPPVHGAGARLRAGHGAAPVQGARASRRGTAASSTARRRRTARRTTCTR